MLARHGFIEPDPDHDSRRERWWRAAPDVLQIHPAEFLDDETAREALRVVTAERLRLAEARLETWLDDRERWSPAWQEAAEDSVFVARLDPEQSRALADELVEVIERHLAAPARSDARTVEIQLNVFPTGERA